MLKGEQRDDCNFNLMDFGYSCFKCWHETFSWNLEWHTVGSEGKYQLEISQACLFLKSSALPTKRIAL